jgi:predicted DNA-binding transcriptional regulator AlpA
MKTDARIDQQLIGYGDLKLFGITFSRPHLYRLIKEGKFPSTVKLSENRVAFRRKDLQDYIDNLETGMCTARRKVKTKKAAA